MQTVDTIVALATGWGSSTRALVRLSGPLVPEVLRTSTDPPIDWPTRASFLAARLRIERDSPTVTAESLMLPILVAMYPSPRSYTGEASAELLVPGNPRLIERVICGFTTQRGVREATPGEFSARAYLNGRLTLAQAEGVAATIAARNDDELAAARRVMQGDAGKQHEQHVDELATLLALVEAGIDFTDQEDVVPISPADLRLRVGTLADELRRELGSSRGSERHSVLPSVVLAGAPNAGKSTLFNALLGRHRSVVSAAAGTTRDVIAEDLDLSDAAPGLVVRLVDLAGLDDVYRHEEVTGTTDMERMNHTPSIDTNAQARARAAIAEADVVVYCDPRGSYRDRLRESDTTPGRASQTVVRVQTKADLVRAQSAIATAGTLGVCALDGWNLGPLRRAIADAAWGGEEGRVSSALGCVLPRHRRAIARAVDSLEDTLVLLDARRSERALASPELIAGSLREALDAACDLVGRLSPDDVIGRIFATFCIGK